MSRNYGCTRENLLNYLYRQKYYKLTGTDLSSQTNTSVSQKINFTGKLEESDDAKMLFVSEKKQKNIIF